LHFALHIAEAALLASALNADCFVSGFAYGSRQIRIPFASVMVVSLICSGVLGLSLLAGSLLRPFLPDWLTTAACFAILFFLGMTKLLDSVTKSIIRKRNDLHKQLRFSLFNFRFVLSLYADPEAADADRSLTLSPAEAVPLAAAVSLDGMAVGFGAALGDVNGWVVIAFSLVTGVIALTLGERFGHRLARALKFNISWLSGVILIAMAVLRLV